MKMNPIPSGSHLSDLFGSIDHSSEPLSAGQNLNRIFQQRHFRGRFFKNSTSFFTLRLEHRKGGSVARSRDEERVLLFRSDRAGAIGKIIYSSAACNKRRRIAVEKVVHTPEDSPISANNYEEEELSHMAQAKIHVLDVKEQYRGMDLGGLLFAEAIRSLRRKYENDTPTDRNRAASGVRCQLEAEEDLSRHNKLIQFYEQLGCSVKPNTKVQILYNNDGTTYRKVPMQITLTHLAEMKKRKRDCESSSLIKDQDDSKTFLPIHFLQRNGSSLLVPLRKKSSSSSSIEYRRMRLLIVQETNGLSFRSTQGHQIRIDKDGNMIAVPTDVEVEESSKHDKNGALVCFHVTKVSDIHDGIDQLHPCLEDEDDDLSNAIEARLNKLWVLQTLKGDFLGADERTGALKFSKHPIFWQADNDTLSLICTNDTPGRRKHYRNTWARQSVNFVMKMRERYFDFGLKRMSIREALEIVKTLKCHPFRVTNAGPNLRTLLFKTAEFARMEGHPDWAILLALIHELGRVVSCIETPPSEDNQKYDWTFAIRSRVLGCAPPSRTNFAEFRNLDPDLSNAQSKIGIYQEHCGMENLFLSWTGPEYMYFMLKHNGASLPEEAFGVLRLFPLGDWHTHDEYLYFSSKVDNDMKDFVLEFDKMRKSVRRDCAEDLSDIECNALWEEYYESICHKYECGQMLSW